MLQWILLVGVGLFAWAGWARAGRLARKLDALNQSYWELRYDFTRLKSQVARLDPAEPAEDEAPVRPQRPDGGVCAVVVHPKKE